MSILLDILAAPLMGPLKLTQWVGEKIKEVVDQESGDEGKVKAELIELQMKLEMGDISQKEYDKKEKEIIDRLNKLKKAATAD